MVEEKIAERIDANLLNIPVQQLTDIPRQMFESKVTKLSEKTQGSLIIKEYPTAAAHSGHFKGLLNELALKKSFKPHIIFIDYLNICASSRYRARFQCQLILLHQKQSLRNLEVLQSKQMSLSYQLTQTTRSGYSNSDVDLTDTSESFGLPFTADLMFALISTEELEEVNQIMVKQLKNRYNDLNRNKRFVIGIDRSKMKLYDCDQSAQDDIVDSGQEEEYNNDESKKIKNKFAKLTF